MAVAVRWRAELLAVGATAASWYAFGGRAVAAAAVVLAGLVAAVPAVRSRARGLLQAVIVMHRVLSG